MPEAVLLEKNIITLAQAKLADLEEMIKNPSDDAGVQDLHNLSSELFGLTQLREIKDSGLSEEGQRALDQVDVRVLYLMRKNAGLAS